MISLYCIKGGSDGEFGILAYVKDLSFQISGDLMKPPSDRFVVGLVRPEKDGNYYQQLIVFGAKGGEKLPGYFYGAEDFLSDLRGSFLSEGTMVVSEDFPFEMDELSVVKLSDVG